MRVLFSSIYFPISAMYLPWIVLTRNRWRPHDDAPVVSALQKSRGRQFEEAILSAETPREKEKRKRQASKLSAPYTLEHKSLETCSDSASSRRF